MNRSVSGRGFPKQRKGFRHQSLEFMPAGLLFLRQLRGFPQQRNECPVVAGNLPGTTKGVAHFKLLRLQATETTYPVRTPHQLFALPVFALSNASRAKSARLDEAVLAMKRLTAASASGPPMFARNISSWKGASLEYSIFSS